VNHLKPAAGNKLIHAAGFACLLLLLSSALAAETETDSALWAGGLFLFERDKGLDYSAEYQLRLGDHMSSLSSHFLEFLGYRKTTRTLLLYGGYRYTRRPDHNENRLVFGGFWDLTQSGKKLREDPGRFKAVLQVAYQHDFNVEFDEQSTASEAATAVSAGAAAQVQSLLDRAFTPGLC
jgi:hypothetical protein